MAETVTTTQGTFEIRSEAHGPHWVAWLARTPEAAPEHAILLVGETQTEAETRARQWAERLQSSSSSANAISLVTDEGTAVARPVT
jgi:hypothetical protein